MSAKSDVADVAQAAVGVGDHSVIDPLSGFPNDPFFNRKLRFVSATDSMGRIRLAALTTQE